MTLLELISTIDENVERVNVYLNDELVTFYDGKNSIDERYNVYSVESYFFDDVENVFYIDLEDSLMICPKCGCTSYQSELIETIHHSNESFTVCHWCFEISKVVDWELYRI